MSADEARRTLTNDPVAQQLLHSTIPARLAYTWRDGTPRVVPMWFHWTGEEILMGAPPNAPKMKVLAQRPEVALTIDANEYPYKGLCVRGATTVEAVDGPIDEKFPEYGALARRYLGEDGGRDFMALRGQTFSRWIRITIRPEEVRILDMGAGQFPSAWSSAS